MALSPLSPALLNTKLSASPSLNQQIFMDMTEVKKSPLKRALPVASNSEPEIFWDDEPSSPFVTEIAVVDKEIFAANKVFDFSPSKQMKMDPAPFTICEDSTSTPAQANLVVISSPVKNSSFGSLSTADDTDLLMGEEDDEAENAVAIANEDSLDDTCFSAFSEIPNMDMTKFARMSSYSPSKLSLLDTSSRPSSRHVPSLPSTPRHSNSAQENDTTNLLVDFTQQFDAISTFSQRLSSISSRRSPTKSTTTPPLLAHLQNQRSPRKAAPPVTPLRTINNSNILNLLDFDLPPAPTPRSIPTITIRELESLKSSYASQICSLNATLSGRGAEVEALKRAISDAERRVGEATELAREDRTRRECVEKEKEEWERRGREFEGVLKQVRSQVMESEREKNELLSRCEEAEELVKEMEQKVAEVEARAVRAEAASSSSAPSSSTGAKNEANGPLFTVDQVQAQIDQKIHTLSTELHAIYKKKHVTKVAGLKKGFEAKTAQKTGELQSRIEELEKQNEDMQLRLDSTFSGTLSLPTVTAYASSSAQAEQDNRVIEASRAAEAKVRARLNEQAALIERQRATLAGRDEELRARQSAYAALAADLERERVEKGELVAAVDEMLALQGDMSVLNAAGERQGSVEDVMLLRESVMGGNSTPAPVVCKNGRGNNTGALKGPGFGFAVASTTGGHGPSRLGAPSSGLARPVATKSKIMSNIERMGGARSVD